MCRKLFAIFILIFASVVAVLILNYSQDQEKMMYLFNIARFVELIVPILGAGALIKYLFSCGMCPSCKNKTNTP